MMAISLPHVIAYALFVSAALVWFNVRGAGVVGAAAGVIVVCGVIGLIHFVAYGQATVSREAVQVWLSFVLLPAALVFGLSRMAWLRNSPWWLLLLGPLAFVVGVVLVTVTYNVLFASRHPG